ncbi:MAG: hypothetical protein JWR69_14 [Pedosphaera sp.]|nr:hypothetical protein [Pedosphaera sp.]
MNEIIKALGLPAGASLEQTVAAIRTLKQTEAEAIGLRAMLQAGETTGDPDIISIGKAIQEKIRAGLSFEMAIQVITEQDREDRAKAKEASRKAIADKAVADKPAADKPAADKPAADKAAAPQTPK